MIMDDYLNQSATIRSKTGTNAFGEPVFTDVPIKCRWEANQKLLRDTQGQQVVSVGRVFTNVAVKPTDLLNDGSRDWVVISVADMPDLDGITQYWEVNV